MSQYNTMFYRKSYLSKSCATNGPLKPLKGPLAEVGFAILSFSSWGLFRLGGDATSSIPARHTAERRQIKIFKNSVFVCMPQAFQPWGPWKSIISRYPKASFSPVQCLLQVSRLSCAASTFASYRILQAVHPIETQGSFQSKYSKSLIFADIFN